MQALLEGETDLEGFRAKARLLLARKIPPEAVHWTTAACSDLFAEDGGELGTGNMLAGDLWAGNSGALLTGNDAGGVDIAAEPHAPFSVSEPSSVSVPVPMQVPAAFLQLCRQVILHSDPQRFALLYRLLWRLSHEPSLRHDPLDADMLRAQSMAQAVRRDMHKMKAFVRFRTVTEVASSPLDNEQKPEVLHVAWFEPAHHVVEAIAPWFARRFSSMRWAILTPRRCVAWDARQLSFRAGASKAEAPPADAGEALWLTYYEHIFNPARLKLKMMQKEMPRKYWHNLPEARLIAPLAAAAHERSGKMIASAAPLPNLRIPVLAASTRPLTDTQSLEGLKEASMRCRECPIGEHATQSVTGTGPQGAALMFVGEQPGDQEDLRGTAFVGPAGQLLDQVLAELGIGRSAIFVTNAVKHFKFELRGKRRIHKTPSQREAAACAHWLESEIALIKPRALVALGATAARSLMGYAVAVTAERGKWLTRPDGLRVLITLHPAALLRMEPQDKAQGLREFIADLQQVTPLLPR
jgi:probable DNA metabolism protein